MLNVTDKEFHKIGPKDVGILPDKKIAMTLDIIRTTNHTGEQLHMAVPVYGDETREEIDRRFKFAFSFIQDRLEAENEAINWRNKREQIIRNAQVAIQNNQKHLEKQLNELKKNSRKHKWSQEQFEHERKLILQNFEAANATSEKAAVHAKKELDRMEELPLEAEQEFEIQPLDGSEDNTASL